MQPHTRVEDDTAASRRKWNRHARFYDVYQSPMEWMGMRAWRERTIALAQGTKVLEVGAGTGRNFPLYAAGQQVDAVDFSAEMVARARRRTSPAAVTCHLMDIEHLGFGDQTFDAVVSTCVFCSVPHPVDALEQVRRVLRPDGRVVLLEHMRPAGRWLGPLFDRLDPFVSRVGPHINRRTADNIEAAGLLIESEQHLFGDVVRLIVARPA